VSATMNLHQVPETITLDRAVWVGRIMSTCVVIALVADGTIQLFAPAQIASMLQETGFAMEVTRVVGPIILACVILYAIPATAVLGAILVTGFLGGASRVGEDVATLAPHRPGRAGFQHPVPHVRASLVVV
jgi:DoxX-like family